MPSQSSRGYLKTSLSGSPCLINGLIRILLASSSLPTQPKEKK
ncbi:hypothetical protein HMPREF9371_0195 [Neisseria shayeganii 871]|uniref:Uncharacterized protein n=1 Tax=Neisseria shayeganii 871 TaxID=1032488 RepID=G4CF06_9NEIS|nr:hypothetical protein HMPREF9371_0195 [Neisseria shayeganii 871]